MFFELWVLWGDAGFFVLFASGWLGWLLIGWIVVPAGTVFVLPEWILSLAGSVFVSPGLHFEFFVSLWGEPGALGARQSGKFETNGKRKRLGSSIGSSTRVGREISRLLWPTRRQCLKRYPS